MDTSKEYILMCEKAFKDLKIFLKDLYDEHTPTASAYLNDKWNWEIVYFDSLEEFEGNGSCQCDSYVGYTCELCKWGDRLPFCSASIPLWRQDQLQDIINKKYPMIRLIEKFCIFVRSIEFTGNVSAYHYNFESMEQLWLAFVMKEKFNKCWNGNDWEKIK